VETVLHLENGRPMHPWPQNMQLKTRRRRGEWKNILPFCVLRWHRRPTAACAEQNEER